MRVPFFSLWMGVLPLAFAAEPVTVFAPAQTDKLHLNDATAVVEETAGGERTLVTALGAESPWPGIRLEGLWDILPGYTLVVELGNLEDHPISLTCRLDREIDGKNRMFFFRRSLNGRERVRWEIPIKRALKPEIRERLFGMRYFPGNILERDADSLTDGMPEVRFIRIYADHISQPLKFAVYGMEIQPAGAAPREGVNEAASGRNWHDMTAAEFFPMIDRYGQFKHEDWPGKIHSDEELLAQIPKEEADLNGHPRPADWNQYGGWTKGPQLPTTGHFQVRKVAGKWWLVDPDGRLFWSHGPTCVRLREGSTPITDREHLFEWLPPQDGEFGFCYGKGNGAPFAYYTPTTRGRGSTASPSRQPISTGSTARTGRPSSPTACTAAWPVGA